MTQDPWVTTVSPPIPRGLSRPPSRVRHLPLYLPELLPCQTVAHRPFFHVHWRDSSPPTMVAAASVDCSGPQLLPPSLRSNLDRPIPIRRPKFTHTPSSGTFAKESLHFPVILPAVPDFDLIPNLFILIRKIVRFIYKSTIDFVLAIKSLF